jgi:signal transduction histidine kinase
MCQWEQCRQMMDAPIRFLLVDDTPANLLALESLVRRDGLEVLKAGSGAQALELLLEADVDLAFLDVQLPDMDGFELAELMRGAARTRQIPIIFVTAGARDPERLFKGYEAGAVDFLYKPIDPQVLKGKVDTFFELSRQRRELAQALHLNEMFVGILGHDLRTPLSAMLTGAHVLEQELSEESSRRTLRQMALAGQRMTAMIEQLLDLTRARLAGGLGFVAARARVEIGQLVQRAGEELRVAHPDREIVVRVEGDCLTTGDADRLLQLFSNLIANALQHGARSSPITVVVDGRAADIAVTVHNLGVIPPELLPILFEPFRGRPNRAAHSRGLGLGLFISQQIAAAHGGNVTVTSNQREGTTFQVWVARRVVGERALGVPSRNLLIVDPDESIRGALRAAFEERGYAVASAAGEIEALEALGEGQRPEALILNLPSLSASRLYQTLQGEPSLARIPVLWCTARPAAAPAGVRVLTKPLQLERLIEAVEALGGDRVPRAQRAVPPPLAGVV